MPMTAPGSVAGITPLAQLAPDAPSSVMDALQQLRAVLAPYERPVEAPVVPADPRDRMQDAIDAVDATVTNRTQLRTLPTALLALSDKSKDERRALIQTPLYQRAPEEAQKDALRDQLAELAPRVVPLVERVAADFAAVRSAWPAQRQPGKQLLLPKARPEVWDLVQLILTVPLPGALAVVGDLVAGEADALMLEDTGWALWQRRGDPQWAEPAFAVHRRVRAQVLQDAGRAQAFYGAAYASALLREMKHAAESLVTALLTKGTLDVVEQQTSFPWFRLPLPADAVAMLVGALPQDDKAELLELFGLRDAGSTGASGEDAGPLRVPERASVAAT